MEQNNSQDQHQQVDNENSMQVDEAGQSNVPIAMKQPGESEQIEQESSVPIQKRQDEVQQLSNQAQQLQQPEIEDPRLKLKQTIMKLFAQTKVGCKKDVCLNKYCKKNPFEVENLNFATDNERLKHLLILPQQHKDGLDFLLCSNSESLNSKNFDGTSDQKLRELFEDAYAFATSFTPQGNDYDDQEMEDLSQPLNITPSKQNKAQEEAKLKALKKFSVDIETLYKVYGKIDQAFEDQEKLLKGIETLVSLFSLDYNNSERTPENGLLVWRGMLMLLANPNFVHFEWSQSLEQVIVCCNDILKTHKKHTYFKDFLLHCLPKKTNLQIIQNIQSYITISIMSGLHNSKIIEYSVRTMDIFFEANEERRMKERISFKEFNNDAINKEVSLKDHFIAWISEREKCRQHGRIFDRHKVFTLCSYPWILDAANKSELLKIQNRIEMDNQLRMNPLHILQGMGGMYLMFEVRREHILEDTLRRIQTEKDFNKQLRVVFAGEPGIDEGGVKKEFFQILTRQLFDANFGMFTYNDKERLYWFNGLTHEPNINFELIGILMGLAIFNNIILDVPLPKVCYKKLLLQDPTFDDLREWQPEVAQSLEFILTYNNSDCPLEQALGINFTIEIENWGEKVDHELKEGGSEIMVTEENREEYVDLYIQYIFSKQCENQINSFQKGFFKVCNRELMTSLFKPEELELLICGSKKLDFLEFQRAARYVDGYTEESQVVQWLWEIVHELNDDQKKQFLAFCTGSDRAPILGLGSVRLYVGRHGDDCDRLPSAHTCFNHLLIPEYTSKDKLKQKLLLAINNSEGFGLM